MIKMTKITKEKGKVMGLYSTYLLSLPSPSDEQLGRFHNLATVNSMINTDTKGLLR